MPATYTSARDGLTTSVALKAPCKVMASTNITLSGEQTIDSVSCVAGDRVLVKGQTSGAENGIYVVSTSGWSRALDFDGALDVVSGTRVFVNSGTAYAGMEAQVTTADPIIIGETAISFTLLTVINSGIADDLATLAPIAAAISTVADNADNVSTVAANDANVTAVGASIDDVNTLAAIADQFGDLASIATSAATSADEAAASATASETARDESVAASVSALPKAGGTMTGGIVMSGAVINEAEGSAIASATTIDLDAATGNFVHVTGTTAITTVTLAQGAERVVVFDGALTLTNGSSLILPGSANIGTAAGDSAVFRGEGAGVTRCTSYSPLSAVPIRSVAIQGGFKNLKIVATDGTTAPVVTADQVTVEDTSGRAKRLSSLSVTMNLGTTGAGALDAGTIAAAKMYFIWAIAKEDGTQSALASLSSTAPTMPTDYTMKARIGTVVTKQGAATLLGTLQYGRRVQYAQPQSISSGAQGTYSATAPTWSAKTVAANSGATAFVPLTASQIALLLQGNLGSGTSANTYAAPNGSYGGYQSTNPPPLVAGLANGAPAVGSFILEATTIQFVGSNTQSAVYCIGWEENL